MREGTHRLLLTVAAPALMLVVDCAAAAEQAARNTTGLGETGSLDAMIKVTMALALVVGAIFASAWFFKRIGYNKTGGMAPMRVLGGVSMGARERIVLVEVGDVQLVVGVAPGRIQTLHVMDEPVKAGDAKAATPDFASRLSAMLNQRRAK